MEDVAIQTRQLFMSQVLSSCKRSELTLAQGLEDDSHPCNCFCTLLYARLAAVFTVAANFPLTFLEKYLFACTTHEHLDYKLKARQFRAVSYSLNSKGVTARQLMQEVPSWVQYSVKASVTEQLTRF